MVLPAMNLGIAFCHASFTRPNNTFVYASGDVVTTAVGLNAGTTINFPDAVSAIGGSGSIIRASMADSANQVVKGSFELWLFHTVPVVDGDNAPWTPTFAELVNRIAIIPLATVYVGNAGVGPLGNCVYYSDLLNMPVMCGPDTTIRGVLIVRGTGYTPVALEQFDFELQILQG